LIGAGGTPAAMTERNTSTPRSPPTPPLAPVIEKKSPMKTSWFKFAGVLPLTLAASLTACGVGGPEYLDGTATDQHDEASEPTAESVDLGTLEQSFLSCANPDGTNSAMAALAVAVAQELGRWQAKRDVVVATTSVRSGNWTGTLQSLQLSSGSDAFGPKGRSRCAGGNCAAVQALLDMQYPPANGKVYLQGSGTTKVLLNPDALRSRLLAKFGEQLNCEATAKDNTLNACPKEEHVLTFQRSAKGSCDTNFFFKATKPNGQALAYPKQLRNKLQFADMVNPYLDFQSLGGGVVSVDPTYGLNEDGNTTTGACTAACTKVSTKSVAGQCCSCGGVAKKFVKSAWSTTTFLCQ
jgi:predicted small lipoprotein YifL